jgi:hypothetical protein
MHLRSCPHLHDRGRSCGADTKKGGAALTNSFTRTAVPISATWINVGAELRRQQQKGGSALPTRGTRSYPHFHAMGIELRPSTKTEQLHYLTHALRAPSLFVVGTQLWPNITKLTRLAELHQFARRDGGAAAPAPKGQGALPDSCDARSRPHFHDAGTELRR